MNEIDEAAPTTSIAAEAAALVQEMGKARIRVIEQIRNKYGLQPHDALARVEAMVAPDYTQQLIAQPIETLTWFDFDLIAQADPAQAASLWEEISVQARNELASGHRAAKAVEGDESNCLMRARFLAQREELTNEWRPTNGQERLLIDTMTQALAVQEKWLKRLTVLDDLDPSEEPESALKAPRVNIADAIERAAAIVDRFNRIYIRALRQLRDLRRYTPSVIVQNAGQVNVGNTQVNVTAGDQAGIGDTG